MWLCDLGSGLCSTSAAGRSEQKWPPLSVEDWISQHAAIRSPRPLHRYKLGTRGLYDDPAGVLIPDDWVA